MVSFAWISLNLILCFAFGSHLVLATKNVSSTIVLGPRTDVAKLQDLGGQESGGPNVWATLQFGTQTVVVGPSGIVPLSEAREQGAVECPPDLLSVITTSEILVRGLATLVEGPCLSQVVPNFDIPDMSVTIVISDGMTSIISSGDLVSVVTNSPISVFISSALSTFTVYVPGESFVTATIEGFNPMQFLTSGSISSSTSMSLSISLSTSVSVNPIPSLSLSLSYSISQSFSYSISSSIPYPPVQSLVPHAFFLSNICKSSTLMQSEFVDASYCAEYQLVTGTTTLTLYQDGLRSDCLISTYNTELLQQGRQNLMAPELCMTFQRQDCVIINFPISEGLSSSIECIHPEDMASLADAPSFPLVAAPMVSLVYHSCAASAKVTNYNDENAHHVTEICTSYSLSLNTKWVTLTPSGVLLNQMDFERGPCLVSSISLCLTSYLDSPHNITVSKASYGLGKCITIPTNCVVGSMETCLGGPIITSLNLFTTDISTFLPPICASFETIPAFSCLSFYHPAFVSPVTLTKLIQAPLLNADPGDGDHATERTLSCILNQQGICVDRLDCKLDVFGNCIFETTVISEFVSDIISCRSPQTILGMSVCPMDEVTFMTQWAPVTFTKDSGLDCWFAPGRGCMVTNL